MNVEPSVWQFVVSFSRHLLMVGELGLLCAILIFRTGSGIGLPLLFWHEERYKQFFNGVFVSFFGAETLFVGFLLDGRGAPFELPAYFAAGALSLAVLVAVLTGVALSLDAFTAPLKHGSSALQEERGSAVGLTPPMRMKAGQPMRSARAPTLPLLVGIAVGGGIVAGGVAVFGAVEEWLARIADSWIAVPFTLGVPQSEKPRHLLAGLFFTAFFAFYLAGAFSRGLRRVSATPAIAFSALLAVIAGATGFLTFHDFNPLLIVAVLMGSLWLGGALRYKLKVPALRAYYGSERLVRGYSEPSSDGAASKLLALESIPSWRSGDERRRPIAIVCASGGGIRAAVWTSAMLAELEQQLDDFPYQTRLVAGASGGMVGAAAWVASLTSPLSPGVSQKSARARDVLDALVRSVAKDSLSETIKHLVFRDLPLAFWPNNGHDRGQILESTWCENMGAAFCSSFGALRDGESEGWRPSLVFSPMLIEDGRRLLISNLDLEFLTLNESARSDPPSPPFSRSAHQFARLFPDAWPSFPISTAARMSATFPYVTPAAVLPTEPRRRVVDAGYYDNYGVNVACGWLDECLHDESKRRWLQKVANGVVIIQIRDGVSALGRVDRSLGSDRAPIALARGFEGISGPPAAVLAARESAPLFRNDEQLEILCDLFRKDPAFSPGFLTTALFEFDGKASLSWYLTGEETEALLDHARCGEEFPKLYATMATLKKWWQGRAPGA